MERLQALGFDYAGRIASSRTPMPHPQDTDAWRHMRLLVDGVSSMLAYWDRDLLCRFANRAYVTWFGVDPDHLLGRSLRDLLGPELFALNEPHIRKALAGERQVFERVVPGPGGARRHALAEYTPDVVGGKVAGFLVQVTNLTELKETQAALRRERELRRQIEAQSLQLNDLLRERTEMLGILAHEVRQPLNNASAAMQRAQGSLRQPNGQLAAEQVTRAQAVLGEVQTSIDNTLAVASLLVRPGPIALADADIDTLVAVVVADMPPAHRSRVRIHRDTATRTALMDMSLMRLALRNVLANALKFSPPESPVQVAIADSDEPLALVIDVSDAGPGIEAALLPRLFSRGARGVDVKQGMGLGLYIAKQVMAAHGGAIEVLRTGATGTTIRLAIVQADDDKPWLPGAQMATSEARKA